MLIRAKNRPELIYGTLRFAYMIPIPKECLSMLIRDELNDSQKSLRIRNELAFCRRNKDKIVCQAELTYNRIISNKSSALNHNSCDFKLLAQAYIEYCIANDLEEAKNSEEKLFIEKINHIAEWADEIINTANERSAETNKQKNLMLK